MADLIVVDYKKTNKCETWTFAPPSDSPSRITGAETIKKINEISERLTNKLDIWLSNEADYPSLPANMLNKCGKDISNITNRPIWVIGGYAFFRRYNDDWNPTFMYMGSKFGWQEFGTDRLELLHELVMNTNPTSITKAQIDKII
jgi:hypothetical protein